jgi:hypothetical protein
VRFVHGLVIGLLVGGASGVGASYLWVHRNRGPKIAVTAPALDGGTTSTPKKKPHKHGNGGSGGAGDAPDDGPVPTLSPADLQTASEGDALKAANRTMDMTSGAAEVRDLSQDEIDAAVGRKSGAIIKCITDARGNAPLNSGHISVGFVVGADGGVTRTRVEAPAYLIHHGFPGCARPLLSSLRFPATGKESVVTVPFDLHESP